MCRGETGIGYYPFSSPGRDTASHVMTSRAWASSWEHMARRIAEQVHSLQWQHAHKTTRRTRDIHFWLRGRDTKFCVVTQLRLDQLGPRLQHDFYVTTGGDVLSTTRRDGTLLERNDTAQPGRSVCATWALCARPGHYTHDLGSRCAHYAHDPVLRQCTI